MTAALTPKEAASRLTAQSLINCFLKETGRAERLAPESTPEAVRRLFASENAAAPVAWLRIRIDKTERRLFAPVAFFSTIGQHRFLWPFVLKASPQPKIEDLVAVGPRVATALVTEIVEGSSGASVGDVAERIGQSEAVLAKILEERWSDMEALFGEHVTYLEAEQGLLVGHPLHPVPKSRLGMRPEEVSEHSPETKGRFRLHYFAADPEWVWQDSALDRSAAELMREILEHDARVLGDEDAHEVLERTKGRVLLPAHPLELGAILRDPAVQAHMAAGRLTYVGPLGAPVLPTSSLRTVAHPELPWQLKLSLGLGITNSRRINRHRELVRAIEATRLMAGPFGRELKEVAESLTIITDPAALSLRAPDGQEYVEALSFTFRPNPFGAEDNASLLVALTQDHPKGEKGRLRRIVETISQRTGKPLEETTLDWYRRFLDVSILSILRAYIVHGLAIEGHQQNLVLTLDRDLMPSRCHYRDNQGIFHKDTAHEHLTARLPGLGEESGSIGPEDLVDERLGYYLVQNSAMGMADALAYQCGVESSALFGVLRASFESLEPLEREHGSSVISFLLEAPGLPCKANLATRTRGMDELIGDPRFQSVYVPVANPLRPRMEAPPFAVRDESLGVLFQFREFSIEKDLDLYHQWMNQRHVSKWWNLALSKDELRDHLRRHQANPNQALYIGFVDDVPVSYWERYWVGGDILGKHLESHERFDQGLHLLIGNSAYMNGTFPERMIVAFTRLCFASEPRTRRVLGEPDARNRAVIRHADKTGFVRQGSVELPDKTAALMVAERERHYAMFEDMHDV